MDKNKWIEEKIKEMLGDRTEFARNLIGSPFHKLHAMATYDQTVEQLSKSLEEAWEKGEANIADDDEVITINATLDEALKPEYIDIKPLLDCKPKKTLLNQSK